MKNKLHVYIPLCGHANSITSAFTTISLHDSAFLRNIYKLSTMYLRSKRTWNHPGFTTCVCLKTSLTSLELYKWKTNCARHSFVQSHKFNYTRSNLFKQTVRAHKTDKSISCLKQRCRLRSCHAHFLPFVKPATIFRGEILISQDFALWIPAWKISNRTWSVSMLHRSVSLLKGNLSSHALGFLTETSVVLPSAHNIGMTWELSGSLQENANTHCTELKRGNLNGAGEST